MENHSPEKLPTCDLALLRQAAAHAHAAAVLAAQLAGLEPDDIAAEVAAMFRSSEAALHSWAPPDGWHW